MPAEIMIDKSPEPYDSVISRAESLISLHNSDIEVATTTEYGAFSAINKISHRRFILYSPEFFNDVSENRQNDLSVLSICLHELGHLMYNHPLRRTSTAQIFEKEADRFSGYYMCLAGATLDQSLAAIKKFGNENETETHPDKAVRAKEIEAGYIDARINIFKDTTYKKQRDSITVLVQQTLAMNKIKKSMFKKDSSKRNLAAGAGEKTKEPTLALLDQFVLLGETIYVDAQNNVRSNKEKEPIGKFLPATTPGNGRIMIEDVSYTLENGQIYSGAPKVAKLSVGHQIN
jgi:hypothetical protein